jgi:hypothetical protein
MLSPHLTSIVAQQHIAEQQRTAARHHLMLATADDVRRPDTKTASALARWLRRHLTKPQPVSR